MEVHAITVVLAPVSAFVAATLLVLPIITRVKRMQLFVKAQAGVIENSRVGGAFLRNGIVWLNPVAKRVLKQKAVERFIQRLESILLVRGYITTKLSLTSLLLAFLILMFCLGAFLGSSPLIGLAAAVVFPAIIDILAKQAQETRKEALRESIPDALRSMSLCSHAGYSLRQTFEQLSLETAEPLKSLFRRTVHDLETGKPISLALDVFRKHSDIDELAFVSVALDVQHRSGGSLQQVLDAAKDSVESELELRRTLRVQTAQAKLSARIVSVMPFILITLFSFLSPSFLDPFFRSLEGLALLGLAVVMEVSGIVLVRRLLKVEID